MQESTLEWSKKKAKLLKIIPTYPQCIVDYVNNYKKKLLYKIFKNSKYANKCLICMFKLANNAFYL